MTRHVVLAALTVVLLTACRDAEIAAPDMRQRDADRSSVISDAAHSAGKPHFYFLPPMVASPTYSGVFDGSLAPSVEVCEWSGSACGPSVASFSTTSGPGGEMVRVTTDQQYIVNWHTSLSNLDPAKTYRIRVLVGGAELGFADVDVVSTGKELKNVNTNEYIPLLDDRTLPIKFRVEQGFVARVDVAPSDATIAAGNAQQYVATLRDLHDAVVTGVSVAWSTANAGIATVNQSGLATAQGDGQTTVYASAAGVTGSATLSVLAGAFTLGAGGYHTCALTTAGAAYCWGFGVVGQLGNGTTFNAGSPVAVTGGHVFRSIVNGYYHSCGLEANGSAWCWGYNVAGQLGNGSSTDSPTPVAVGGGHAFRSLTAGVYHTCGLTDAGDAWCWGYNPYGQLGNGVFNPSTTVGSALPVAVSGSYTFRSLAAGGFHTCGITTGGASLCWGMSFYGQLGTGSLMQSPPYGVAVPTAIGGSQVFASITPSYLHTCALTASGSAYCWGFNGNGAAGTGSISAQETTPQAVQGGLSFVDLAPGMSQHACGRIASGAAYCWGLGQFGELGGGNFSNSAVPILVTGGDVWSELAVGFQHTCGITTAGTGKCWGSNGFGQLGDGTFATATTPTLVQGGLTFATP